MNLSYFRININKEEAIARLKKWNDNDFKEIIECDSLDAVSNSLDDNNNWKGSCLFCYENDGWTIFEDLSGGYSDLPGKTWLEFAENNDLIFTGSNDAIPCGEMIVIEKGVLKVEFYDEPDAPEYCKNVYKENDEVYELESWIDVAGYTEEDELAYSDRGTLLIS